MHAAGTPADAAAVRNAHGTPILSEIQAHLALMH